MVMPCSRSALRPVGEQCQIGCVAGGASGCRVGFEGGELIFVDHLRVVEQSPDEGRLAVVNAAAGQEAQ